MSIVASKPSRVFKTVSPLRYTVFRNGTPIGSMDVLGSQIRDAEGRPAVSIHAGRWGRYTIAWARRLDRDLAAALVWIGLLAVMCHRVSYERRMSTD